MSAVPLILIVGGDALAVRVCEELLVTQGHRVALLWMHDHGLATKLERLGCAYFPYQPNDADALRLAGVDEAGSIIALSDDDRLNLQVALKARDVNPRIRVVLRQFNRTLGRKLEQNLPDCSVLSLASHSAAAFVGAALDPACFYALQFPDLDGVQAGFTSHTAAQLGVTGLGRRAAEARLRARIVARNGSPDFPTDEPFAPDDALVVFARVEQLLAESAARAARPGERRHNHARRLAVAVAKRFALFRRMDPILARVIGVTAAILAFAILYFSVGLHAPVLTALSFVAAAFTATENGEAPFHGPFATVLIDVVKVAGIAATGIFIAFAAAGLTRAQFIAVQGLRQIRTRGHVLVCGSGNVGVDIIGFLRALKLRVVAVDAEPDAVMVEMSRRREIELLTGDATRDATLGLCNVANARAVIAVTGSDTANLEVALGARARNPRLPVVMRVQDDAFASSIARQFEAIRTYSTTALAAPAFAMLSRFPGTRARIAFGGEEYNIGERVQGEVPEPPPAERCIPLAVWRRGRFAYIDAFEQMEAFDRLLFLVPLSQFKSAPAGLREPNIAMVP